MTIQVPVDINRLGLNFATQFRFLVNAVNYIFANGQLRARSYTVSGLPDASTVGAGGIVYVSDETGGAVLAFSDGSDWRRVTDRVVVS